MRCWAGLLIGLLLAGAAAAQQRMHVDVDEANPPFMYAQAGRAAGAYPALLGAVFREMKAEVEIRALPWRRALSEIESGAAGVGGLYQTAERLARFDYSEPLFVERINVYMPRGPATYRGLTDLHGKRVGVIRGWSYGDEFDEARRTGTVLVEEVTSDEQNLRKLEAGRLDAALAIEEAAGPRLKQYPGVQRAGTLAEKPTFLAFHKSARMGAFLERFNAALARLKKSGEADRILAQELLAPH